MCQQGLKQMKQTFNKSQINGQSHVLSSPPLRQYDSSTVSTAPQCRQLDSARQSSTADTGLTQRQPPRQCDSARQCSTAVYRQCSTVVYRQCSTVPRQCSTVSTARQTMAQAVPARALPRVRCHYSAGATPPLSRLPPRTPGDGAPPMSALSSRPLACPLLRLRGVAWSGPCRRYVCCGVGYAMRIVFLCLRL